MSFNELVSDINAKKMINNKQSELNNKEAPRKKKVKELVRNYYQHKQHIR